MCILTHVEGWSKYCISVIWTFCHQFNRKKVVLKHKNLKHSHLNICIPRKQIIKSLLIPQYKQKGQNIPDHESRKPLKTSWKDRGSDSRFRRDIKRQLLFFVNITHNFISCVLKVADDSENRGISYAFDRMTGPRLFFKDAIACTSLDGSTGTRWKLPLRDSRVCFIICNDGLALIHRIHQITQNGSCIFIFIYTLFLMWQ